MNKQRAKRIACQILSYECEALLDGGGHLEFEDSQKLEAAIRELQQEMIRRAGPEAQTVPMRRTGDDK